MHFLVALRKYLTGLIKQSACCNASGSTCLCFVLIGQLKALALRRNTFILLHWMHAKAPSACAACQYWISLHALQMYSKFVSWYNEQCSFVTVYAHVSCIYMIMRLVFTSMFAHAPWVSFLWNRERIKRQMHTFTLHAAQNVRGVNTYKISPGHPLNSITAAFFQAPLII